MNQQSQQLQFQQVNGLPWQASMPTLKSTASGSFDLASMYASQMFPFASTDQGSIHPNAVKMDQVQTSFDSRSAEGDEDAAADDDDEVGQDGAAPKAKRTRRRQQTSCTECHRRKQKCNREIPCDRCIKRGTASSCQIMVIGDAADASASVSTSSASFPPMPSSALAQSSQKRKRKIDGDVDLATRVEQLEQFLRMQQSVRNTSFASPAQLISPIVHQQPTSDGSKRSTPSGISYVPPSLPQLPPAVRPPPSASKQHGTALGKNGASSQNAVEEEDAAAALGQLSKAVSKEGGAEARIYSGPGSIADLLSSSAFGRDDDVQEERYMRARPCELALYKGGQPSLAAIASAPAHMKKLADELQEQKTKLPPPQMSHFLFDAVFNLPMFADRNRIFPRTCIQLAYDGLWAEADRDVMPSAEAARAAGYPQLASPNSLAFLSLIYVLLSSALLMQPGTMKDPESQHLASVLYEASRAAFMASERREQPTYAVIVAIMSQAAWLKIVGCPSLGFTYIAQAIRFAQSMGLHREVPPSWDLGGFEIEIRRRLWHMLLCADRGHSISYGRPYMIIAKHCDVAPPSNIYDKDLRPEGPVNTRPPEECTQSTFQLCAIAMAGVMAEVIDRAFSCVTPTYSTILELDNLLTKTEHESVPLAFKNPSITDMIEKPYLKDQYVAYQIQACWLRALLHRPYLLRLLPRAKEPDHYAGSRAAAVMLSQRMISLSKDVLTNVAPHHQAYFGYAFNLFEPAVNLAMAIIQDPGSANATAIDSYVSDAAQMLEAMSGVNKVASEGLSTLRYLQSKYTAAMNAVKGASPSTITTQSSVSKPSPFSLAYSSSGPSPGSASDLQSFGRGAALSNGGSGTSSIPSSAYLSTPQYKGPEAAPTPNTLFNQFFNQYNQYSGMTPAAVAQSDPMEAFSFDKLFNLNPAIYNSDPEAAWLMQPIEGGLAEQWPMTMPRLEGETNFDDWTKSLGLNR